MPYQRGHPASPALSRTLVRLPSSSGCVLSACSWAALALTATLNLES